MAPIFLPKSFSSPVFLTSLVGATIISAFKSPNHKRFCISPFFFNPSRPMLLQEQLILYLQNITRTHLFSLISTITILVQATILSYLVYSSNFSADLAASNCPLPTPPPPLKCVLCTAARAIFLKYKFDHNILLL